MQPSFRHVATILVLLAGLPASVGTAQAQPTGTGAVPGLVGEIEQLSRIDLLPRYRPHSIVEQISSYDTTGGNNDGFSGLYSFVRREGDHLVLADLKGPGVIERIWTPTPTADTLAFYFDGEQAPRIRLPFDELFSGTKFPFLRPVVGNEVGGYYSYVPIPFASSVKIVFEGEKIMFHQIQYRLYTDGRQVESFPVQWNDAERAALERARARWDQYGHPPRELATRDEQHVLVASLDFDLSPGQKVDLFKSDRGGRIVGIELEPADAFTGQYKDLILRAEWDGEQKPAIWSPVADFFGFAYGAPSEQSLLLGTRNGTSYSYLPMPFDRSATMALRYETRAGTVQPPARGTARVYYTNEVRDPTTEGKLYAVWRREIDPAEGQPYRLLRTRGKGHHVGTMLLAQGLNPGMTLFFEGDDVAVVDGKMRIHGTGSEDAFNGGWYALLDRWDQGVSLPIHGSLAYSLPMARTGGYRFQLSDKVPFEKEYTLTIEHGPEGNAVPVDYTSVAFYYGDTPPADVMEPTEEKRVNPMPRVHVFYPQLMRVSLGGGSTVRFAGDDLILTAENDGMLRLDLGEVPEGTYTLFLSFYNGPDGADFSVWQRQRAVSDWLKTASAAEQYIEHREVGKVTITDQIRTISFRTRSSGDHNELRFNRVMLERVGD